MITLDFKGPFSLNAIRSKNEDYAVYIWGFNHPNNKKFIPYYVGEVCGTPMRSRFIQREKEISEPTSTYMRLSDEYMFGLNNQNPFYSDDSFPPNENRMEFPTGGQQLVKWFKKNMGITYLNSWRWAKFNVKTQYTLKEHYLKNKSFRDTLAPKFKNVVIYYSSINRTEINELKKNSVFEVDVLHDQIIVEMCEAFTKYALKGKTVSRANYFSETNGSIRKAFIDLNGIDDELKRLSGKFITIANNSNSIFKVNPTNSKVAPSKYFPGVYY